MNNLEKEAIDKAIKISRGIPVVEKNNDSPSLEELESFGDDESIKEIFKEMASYKAMLKERITFIAPSLTQVIPFTRENLYLIAAYTGSGKSSTAANISYALWKEKKKTLVVSNEEDQKDILMRIACIEKGCSFNAYKKGNLPKNLELECMSLFQDIATYVKIVDVKYKNGFTKQLEGIINLLNTVKDSDFSCIMIDYYQLINKSISNPSWTQYEILGQFRVFLGEYIKRSKVPVVLFAQLHSAAKKKGMELDGRIKHNPEVLETATVAIEVIPNFKDQTSQFLIVKDRFGMTGSSVSMYFKNGKYVDMDEEAMKEIENAKTKEIDDQIGKDKDARV